MHDEGAFSDGYELKNGCSGDGCKEGPQQWELLRREWGDKAPKGQGEEAWKSQKGTWVKVKKPGRPGKVSIENSCPIFMVLVPLQTETLLLQAERRALCACWPAGR